MRKRAACLICLIVTQASDAPAAEIRCDNAASIAEVKAELNKNCDRSVLCKVRLKTVDATVENFKAGKVTLRHCSATLKGIYDDEKRFAPLPPSSPVPPPRGGGGGGGGGGLFPELI